MNSLEHLMDLLLEYFADSPAGPQVKCLLSVAEKDCHSNISVFAWKTEQPGVTVSRASHPWNCIACLALLSFFFLTFIYF